MHVCGIDGCPFAHEYPGQLVRHRREIHPDRLCFTCKKEPRSAGSSIYCQVCIERQAEHERRERERQWNSITGDSRSWRRRMQEWSLKTFPADDAAGASALDAVRPWLSLLHFRLVDRDLREIDERDQTRDRRREPPDLGCVLRRELRSEPLHLRRRRRRQDRGSPGRCCARVLDAHYDWEESEAQYPAFANVVELLDEAKATMRWRWWRASAALYESSLLVLDDLGAERPTDWTRDAIHALVQHRHVSDRPTIVTSNYAPSALARRLGHDDPLIGKRIVSRLTENCIKVECDRPDLRLRRPSAAWAPRSAPSTCGSG